MNVTTFAKDISIVWFFVCAIPLVAVVLLAWWGFRKWNQREREMRMGRWSGGERRRKNKKQNKAEAGVNWWGLWKRNRSNAMRKDHLC